MDIRKRMDELIILINKYNEAYYQNNESLISDLAFDQLLQNYKNWKMKIHFCIIR